MAKDMFMKFDMNLDIDPLFKVGKYKTTPFIWLGDKCQGRPYKKLRPLLTIS